ncbi:MAG: hypothetical protein LZT29_02437 [Pantoea stewartii]|nr:MAG: hypothetical protein LZT29_02437 [Pantoea stewartii]
MDAIKQILIDEINTLNREGRRDNLPRFSFSFLKTHPGLWAVMYLCYGLCVALIFSTDMLGWPAFWFATAFVLVMSFLMLLDINPKYRFEDIDALDLRFATTANGITWSPSLNRRSPASCHCRMRQSV